jgi:hypothetical protein
MTTTEPASVHHLPVTYLAEVHVTFDPAVLVYETPSGLRIDAIASGGTVRGPGLDADVLPGGGDWLTLAGDGVARMDVRATFRTSAGDVVHYTSSGRIALGDDARARFLGGATIEADEMYGRATPLFETAAEPHRWLNRAVAVGRIVELSRHHIRYQLFTLD